MLKNIKEITVKTSSEYQVLIGKNLIDSAGELIREVLVPCKVAVISDDTVYSLYGETLVKALKNSGFSVVKFCFAHGESSKNLDTYANILEFLAKNELTRSDAIVALGGGVVGDIAGFVASTYLRGIKYIQVPTTLLAQIDSSVGGKTGVDLPSGKNLVGAFYQPNLVICDINALETLPKQIFNDGMGEVAKYALLDKKVYDLINGTEYDLTTLVYLCIDYKRQVVEKDEFESSSRKLLNLGHTVAHGIEKLSNYSISHGKAVAMGISVIVEACFKKGYLAKEEYIKIKQTLVKCVEEQAVPYSIKQIAEVALVDKKRSGNHIDMVVVHGVGDCRTEKIVVNKVMEFLI